MIVDDFALVREGLRMALEFEDDIEVVGEAGDGAEAVDAETTVYLIAAAEKTRPAAEPIDRLSPREYDVLRGIGRGQSDEEIGAADGEIAALLERLGARDRVQAVLHAHEARLA
jgi:DNA-binding NarL/FixJ family response regulator